MTTDLAAGLPNAVGVYYFHDAHEKVIYVGKSVDIKKRVQSHLSAAKRSSKEAKMMRQTQRVSCQSTAGELSALLLESFEIKRLLPRFNRRLRRRLKPQTLQLQILDGWLRPTIVDQVWPPMPNQIQYGSYRSRHHAHTALRALIKRAQLCAKVLGLEHSGDVCFAFQLKQCRGACSGLESMQSHNTRVQAAMADKAVEPWPFPSYVGVIETSAPNDVHVFDAWRFHGVCDRRDISRWIETGPDFLHQRFRERPAHVLDFDSYKILISFLKYKKEVVDIIDFSDC